MPVKLFRGWVKGADGVTAIEFSLLALPFIMFVMGIIELATMYAAGFVLQGSVSEAARLIRTGQIQKSDSADPKEIFREALCKQAGILLNCDNVEFEVETLDHFSDADTVPEVNESGKLTETPFETGGVSDIVLIRAIYLYPLMTPMIGQFFSDYPGNKKLLMSTVVLQTEPYDFEDEDDDD